MLFHSHPVTGHWSLVTGHWLKIGSAGVEPA